MSDYIRHRIIFTSPEKKSKVAASIVVGVSLAALQSDSRKNVAEFSLVRKHFPNANLEKLFTDDLESVQAAVAFDLASKYADSHQFSPYSITSEPLTEFNENSSFSERLRTFQIWVDPAE